MDEYAIKRIIGHKIEDITESIYTDRKLDWLLEEVKKNRELVKFPICNSVIKLL